MPSVRLLIDDPTDLVTLRAMLEASGWRVAEEDADVAFADTARTAVEEAKTRPTLLLTTIGEVETAVEAMRQGVFGYVLVPFVPGEAPMMAERAFASRNGADGGMADGDGMRVATLADVEKLHIESVLRMSKYNQAKAARALGIGRNTLWRKLKQYGLAEDE